MRGLIRNNQSLLNRILVGIDGLVTIAALFIAWWLRFESGLLEQVDKGTRLGLTEYMLPLIYLVPLILFMNYLFELYAPQRARRFTEEFVSILKSNGASVLVVMSILFFLKEVHYSRIVLFLFFFTNTLLATGERLALRLILRRLRSQGLNLKYMLILGAGSLGTSFLRKIREHKEYGYEVFGFLDDDEDKQGTSIEGVEVLGNIDSLPEVVTEHQIDEVILALPLGAYKRVGFIINTCEKFGVKTMIIPDYFDFIPARPRVGDVDGIPLIDIRHVPLDEPNNKLLKRSFDIVFSLAVLVLLSPVLIALAVGVKLSSPGPVFFGQERVGINRRPFQMYKFRSMKVSDPATADTQWTVENDPRRTKFGTFLRKTSLDELPQFINVLKGDMSVVGPRPERPYFVEQFKEEIPKYMIKHHVRPGITGWAQVNGWRGDTSIEERIKCDLYYVENWRFALDLKIIVMTILNGFINKNAY